MTNHLKLADSYLRLSDEEKKYGNESESITNQREIIRDYCQKQGIIIVSEFVDDGYSGGNFERPGFQAMLNHLAAGKANTVITKDLSRLGRDMTESSYYAERFFPEHGIHYLAPGNDFDSMTRYRRYRRRCSPCNRRGCRHQGYPYQVPALQQPAERRYRNDGGSEEHAQRCSGCCCTWQGCRRTVRKG